MGVSDPIKIKNRYYSQIKKKDQFEVLLHEANFVYKFGQENGNCKVQFKGEKKSDTIEDNNFI